MKSLVQNIRQRISKFLLITILLFIVVFLLNHETTAFEVGYAYDWGILIAFIKCYIGIILLYFAFHLRNVFVPFTEVESLALKKQLFTTIRTLQRCAGIALICQISINLYDVWHTLGLYPLELGFWESLWTLIRYVIGLLGTWVLELWFWIGKQLRISFLLSNPCLGSICLEEYPWVSVMLTAILGAIVKKLWSISLIRGTVLFFAKSFWSIVRTVGKFVLKRISRTAASSITSILLLDIAKQIYQELKGFYTLPEEKESPDTITNVETV